MRTSILYNNRTLDGITKYLYKRYRKTYYQKILAYGLSAETSPKQAINQQPKSYYFMHEHGSDYLVLYFPYHVIKLNGYLIQNSDYTVGCWIKHWSLSESNDNTTFTNEQTYDDNDNSMNKGLAFKYVPYSSNGFCNSYKLQQTGTSHNCGNTADILKFELFGTIYSTLKCTCSFRMRRRHSTFLYFALLLLFS